MAGTIGDNKLTPEDQAEADAKALAVARWVAKNASLEMTAASVRALDDKGLAQLFGVVADKTGVPPKWFSAAVERERLAVAVTPKAWTVARDAARVEIARRGLTPTALRAMSYREVAEVWGVALGAKGEAPDWFEYQPEKNRMAALLEAEASTAFLETTRVAIEAKLQADPALTSLLPDLRVVLAADGKLEVTYGSDR